MSDQLVNSVNVFMPIKRRKPWLLAQCIQFFLLSKMVKKVQISIGGMGNVDKIFKKQETWLEAKKLFVI